MSASFSSAGVVSICYCRQPDSMLLVLGLLQQQPITSDLDFTWNHHMHALFITA